MNGIVTRVLRLWSVAFLLAVVGGCASDPGGAVITETDAGRGGRDARDRDTAEDATPEPDVAPTEDTAPIGSGAYLEYASQNPARLVFNSQSELAVFLKDEDGTPIEGQSIVFDYDEAFAADTVLRTSTVRTGPDGRAGVTISAGQLPAEFEVTASVRNDSTIDPLVFDVSVASKQESDYVFKLSYGGRLRFDETYIAVFNQQPRACAEIPRDPNRALDRAVEEIPAVQGPTGEYTDVTWELSTGTPPLHYATAWAVVGGQVVAFGCADALPQQIVQGQRVEVPIPLYNVYPRMVGCYEMTTEIDMVDALPANVEQIVRFFGEFLQNPGQAINDLLVQNFPDYANLPAFIRNAVPAVINGLVGLLPADVQAIFQDGGDIYTILTKLTLTGYMGVVDEADDLGLLAQGNQFIVTGMEFTFRNSFYDISFENRGYSPIEAEWTGNVRLAERNVAYELNVEEFGLTLNYGELVLFLLEEVVFPELLGPTVTSLEAFVANFIDCTQIANQVTSDPTFNGIIRNVCTQARDFLSGWLRDFIINQLQGDTTGNFRLSTPVDDACELYDNPQRDAYIDSMGKERPQDLRCKWVGEFRWSQNQTAVIEPVDGFFYANRFSTAACPTF